MGSDRVEMMPRAMNDIASGLGLAVMAVSDVELVGWMPVENADLGALTSAERQAIAGAIPKRRAEYAAARQVAHALIGELGYTSAGILNGSGRKPVFPTGIVGSLSHSDKFALAVVAREHAMGAVGCDVEPLLALPEGTEKLILTPDESRFVAPLPAWYGRLIFSVKEAFHKAQFGLTRMTPGFTDVQVTFDRNLEKIEVLTLIDIGPIPGGRTFAGRVCLVEDHMMTRVCIDKCYI